MSVDHGTILNIIFIIIFCTTHTRVIEAGDIGWWQRGWREGIQASSWWHQRVGWRWQSQAGPTVETSTGVVGHSHLLSNPVTNFNGRNTRIALKDGW